MSKQFDQASDLEEQFRAEAASFRKPSGPVPCGACHWCGEVVKGDKRFCSVECRNDWQHVEERKRQLG